MKKFLLFLTFIFAVSCSGDDSKDAGGSSSGNTVKKITTSSADEGYDRVYTFEYDSDDRVIEINCSGSLAYKQLLEYNATGKIDRVLEVTDDGTAVKYEIEYDGDGRITGAEIDGEQVVIDYYEAWDDYVLDGVINFSFYDNGDLKKLVDYNYTYENNKKGPFDASGISYQILGLFEDDLFQVIGSRKPITAAAGDNEDPLVFTNEYNDEGYITHSVYPVNFAITMTFEY